MTTFVRAGAAGVAHGGRLNEARRRFPGAPSPLIDLSTGINPVPYAFASLRAEAFARLPEPEAVLALQSAAARAYRVADPAMVVAAPGTQILINLLPRLFPQTEIGVLGPTYAEHAACWASAGVSVRHLTALPHASGVRSLVVCNPNNPDGRRLSKADLRSLADQCDLLVIDEAFADFESPGLSFAPQLEQPNVIVLRSFGKSFGLAGLRLGFALSSPVSANVIREAIGPWAVSGPAIEIGCRALADTEWASSARQRLARDVLALDALLAYAGCTIIGGTHLFRLAETAGASRLFDHLGRAGIIARMFEEQPTRLRFGIPAPADWDRVRSALGSFQVN